MQMSAGSPFMALPFSRSSAVRPKVLTKPWCLRKLRIPQGKLIRDIYSSESVQWLTFLYFPTNRNLYKLQLQKRELCKNSFCLLQNPGLCSRQLLSLQNYSFRAIHALLSASFISFLFHEAAKGCKGSIKGYLWAVSGCLCSFKDICLQIFGVLYVVT